MSLRFFFKHYVLINLLLSLIGCNGLEWCWSELCGRVVDGVIISEHVFIARKLGVDHQISWKKRYILLEYWVIRLKKIQVSFQLKNLRWSNSSIFFSLLYASAVLFMLLFLMFVDFFNWNRVKLRYCDGASFAGDSEDEVEFDILMFLKLIFWLQEDEITEAVTLKV